MDMKQTTVVEDSEASVFVEKARKNSKRGSRSSKLGKKKNLTTHKALIIGCKMLFETEKML